MAGENKSNPNAQRMAEMEAIVVAHQAELLRYATRVLHDPHSAQDVVQQAFIRLFSLWRDRNYPAMENLRAWLYRVTHNSAIDHMRGETRRRTLYEKHAAEIEPGTDGDGGARSDRKALVLHHLSALDEKDRQVLLLRLEAGLSYQEIASVTGRSIGNVGCILHHAVKKLAERVRMKSQGTGLCAEREEPSRQPTTVTP